jgi:uncharacterized membrane protein YqjE
MSSATKLEPGTADEPTIGRLIAETTSDLSSLVRDEIALAKSELTFSAKAAGIGVALFAVAGFFAVLSIIILSIAFGFALASLPHIGDTVAFLIVFGVYLIIAAILGFVGLRKVKKVRAPEKTIATMKSNKQVLKRS